MAVSILNFPAASAEAPAAISRIEALRVRFSKWVLYRRTVRELSELSNNELADLGMSRASIRSVAWHAVYGA